MRVCVCVQACGADLAVEIRLLFFSIQLCRIAEFFELNKKVSEVLLEGGLVAAVLKLERGSDGPREEPRFGREPQEFSSYSRACMWMWKL